MTENSSLIDNSRTVCLCDAGQPDYWAAVCVTGSGEDVLWLVCKDALDAEHPRCGTADQPHEQLGPLPTRWRHRVLLASLLCGQPTKAGRPCKVPVARAGDTCAWHRAPTTDRMGARAEIEQEGGET